MLAENTARVLSRSPGFRAETGGPSRDIDRQALFRQRFIAMKVVQFHFGRWREPKIRVLNTEQVRRKLGQLARSKQRGAIHQKWWQDFGVAVLARMHVKKEIG